MSFRSMASIFFINLTKELTVYLLININISATSDSFLPISLSTGMSFNVSYDAKVTLIHQIAKIGVKCLPFIVCNIQRFSQRIINFE